VSVKGQLSTAVRYVLLDHSVEMVRPRCARRLALLAHISKDLAKRDRLGTRPFATSVLKILSASMEKRIHAKRPVRWGIYSRVNVSQAPKLILLLVHLVQMHPSAQMERPFLARHLVHWANSSSENVPWVQHQTLPYANRALLDISAEMEWQRRAERHVLMVTSLMVSALKALSSMFSASLVGQVFSVPVGRSCLAR
jgi:hypothetical protein